MSTSPAAILQLVRTLLVGKKLHLGQISGSIGDIRRGYDIGLLIEPCPLNRQVAEG